MISINYSSGTVRDTKKARPHQSQHIIRSHGQLSSCTISEKTDASISRKLSDGQKVRRTDRQTDGRVISLDAVRLTSSVQIYKFFECLQLVSKTALKVNYVRKFFFFSCYYSPECTMHHFFYVKEKWCFVLNIFRFLCFWWIHKPQKSVTS